MLKGRRQGDERGHEALDIGFEENESLEVGESTQNLAQGRSGCPAAVKDHVACGVAACASFCAEIDAPQIQHSLVCEGKESEPAPHVNDVTVVDAQYARRCSSNQTID
jgi:hypothetical protein